jgi:hypothetical protein
MEIVSYAIIQGQSLQHLEDRVNQQIGEGWIPQGGVSVIAQSTRESLSYYAWTQAMILPAPKPIDRDPG